MSNKDSNVAILLKDLKEVSFSSNITSVYDVDLACTLCGPSCGVALASATPVSLFIYLFICLFVSLFILFMYLFYHCYLFYHFTI